MMQINKINKSQFILISSVVFILFICLYVLHFLLPTISKEMVHSSFNQSIFLFRFVSIIFILLLNHFYLYPKFIESNRYIYYLFIVIGIFIFLIVLPPFLGIKPSLHFREPLPNPDAVNDSYWNAPMIRDLAFIGPLMSLVMYFIALWISFMYSFIQSNIQRKNHNMEQEISFLKNQINPHFVFNSLNNIYSLVLSKSDKAPESILKLSEILRYVFYESNKEMIPLENEINYLKNYITFQQYRVSQNTKINFNVLGNFEEANIAPMILINFVENAFKHGVSTFTNTVIEIDLTYEKGWLKLTTLNSIFANLSPSHHVGIENTLKRLEYHYPKRYSYEDKEIEDKRFFTELKIELL